MSGAGVWVSIYKKKIHKGQRRVANSSNHTHARAHTRTDILLTYRQLGGKMEQKLVGSSLNFSLKSPSSPLPVFPDFSNLNITITFLS